MKDNKYEKLIAVIGLLSLFCITVGISYSVFSYVRGGTTDNSITTGKITFIYEEIDKQGSGISIENALPISDELGMKQSGSNEVFNFTIKSDTNSKVSIPYTVTARKKSDSTLDEKAVKIHLTEVNGLEETVLKTSIFEDLEEAVQSSIPETVVERILYEGEVPANTTGYQKNFRLRMWIPDGIDFSKDEEGNYPYNGKTFSITVNVYSSSEVVIQKTTDNTLQKVTSSYKEKLWQYKDNITKIVIKNKLEPMEGLESFNISESGEGSIIAYYDTDTTTAYIQGDGKIYANSDSSYLFSGFTNLTEIEGLEYLDTSQAENMRYMFQNCSGLINLDLNGWNTSQVTNMSYMFSNCWDLTKLDVSEWNTSKVTDMTRMFYHIGLTELNISNWDTSSVTTMQSMFYSCSRLISLDLNSWDTSKVTNMTQMFASCTDLTNLNVNNWNTSKVTNMYGMFAWCWDLISLDVSSWDTSQVTNMGDMFNGIKLTNLDLSEWNTSKVTNMSTMFQNCSNLTTTINITSTSVTSYKDMFTGAAAATDSQITVNYTAENSDLVNSMIETNNNAGHVSKGNEILPYTVTVQGNSDIKVSTTASNYYPNVKVTLESVSGKIITSFKVNGEEKIGNTFKMPATDVTITDVVTE